MLDTESTGAEVWRVFPAYADGACHTLRDELNDDAEARFVLVQEHAADETAWATAHRTLGSLMDYACDPEDPNWRPTAVYDRLERRWLGRVTASVTLALFTPKPYRVDDHRTHIDLVPDADGEYPDLLAACNTAHRLAQARSWYDAERGTTCPRIQVVNSPTEAADRKRRFGYT